MNGSRTCASRDARLRDVLHFNNAGAALMPRRRARCPIEHLSLEARYRWLRGGGRRARRSRACLQRGGGVAELRSGEIAVIENATRAWDMAFYSIRSSRVTAS